MSSTQTPLVASLPGSRQHVHTRASAYRKPAGSGGACAQDHELPKPLLGRGGSEERLAITKSRGMLSCRCVSVLCQDLQVHKGQGLGEPPFQGLSRIPMLLVFSNLQPGTPRDTSIRSRQQAEFSQKLEREDPKVQWPPRTRCE